MKTIILCLLLCLCHICLSQSLDHICSKHLNSCCNQLTKNVLFDQFISTLPIPSPQERNDLEQMAHTQWLETLGHHCQLSTSTLLLQLRKKLRAEPLLDLDTTTDSTFRDIGVACRGDEKCVWEAIDFIRDLAIVHSFRNRNATLYERSLKMLEPRAKVLFGVVGPRIDDRNFKENLWKYYKVREVGLFEHVVHMCHQVGVTYCLVFIIMTMMGVVFIMSSPIDGPKAKSIQTRRTAIKKEMKSCIPVQKTTTQTEMKAIEKNQVNDPRKELNELQTTIETCLDAVKNELLQHDSIHNNSGMITTIDFFKSTLSQVCLFCNALMSLNECQEMIMTEKELQNEIIANHTIQPNQEETKQDGNALESKEVKTNETSSDCISVPTTNNCHDVLVSKEVSVETVQNENSSERDCISAPMAASSDLSNRVAPIDQPTEIEDEQALDETDFLFEFPKCDEEAVDEEQEECHEPINEEPVVRFGLMEPRKPIMDLKKHYIKVKTNRGVKLTMDASTFSCQSMQDLISKAK